MGASKYISKPGYWEEIPPTQNIKNDIKKIDNRYVNRILETIDLREIIDFDDYILRYKLGNFELRVNQYSDEWYVVRCLYINGPIFKKFKCDQIEGLLDLLHNVEYDYKILHDGKLYNSINIHDYINSTCVYYKNF